MRTCVAPNERIRVREKRKKHESSAGKVKESKEKLRNKLLKKSLGRSKTIEQKVRLYLAKERVMLGKLAKQTAIYGISTIVVRFLSYLLTPIYTRIFGQEAYGIVTDVYALIPFALVLLSMGMESS